MPRRRIAALMMRGAARSQCSRFPDGQWPDVRACPDGLQCNRVEVDAQEGHQSRDVLHDAPGFVGLHHDFFAGACLRKLALQAGVDAQ
jgi:hypothetical protein